MKEIVKLLEDDSEAGDIKDRIERGIRIIPRFIKPSKVDLLIESYSKAKKDLILEAKVGSKELIQIRMENNLRAEAAQ